MEAQHRMGTHCPIFAKRKVETKLRDEIFSELSSMCAQKKIRVGFHANDLLLLSDFTPNWIYPQILLQLSNIKFH
jgi:hypothetical protein